MQVLLSLKLEEVELLSTNATSNYNSIILALSGLFRQHRTGLERFSGCLIRMWLVRLPVKGRWGSSDQLAAQC